MTTALGGNTYDARRHVGRRGASDRRAFSVGLGMVGLTTVVISAWGAITPYVGPTFGYSADGSSAWEWNLTHSVLALIPGAIGVLVGLFYFAPVRTSTAGRRLSLGAAGAIAVACGAWFVIGPVAWPVITDMGQYFVAAPPLRNLANQVGYSLGPGLILRCVRCLCDRLGDTTQPASGRHCGARSRGSLAWAWSRGRVTTG